MIVNGIDRWCCLIIEESGERCTNEEDIYQILGESNHPDDTTDSCGEHLAVMLGSPDWLPKDNHQWTVVELIADVSGCNCGNCDARPHASDCAVHGVDTADGIVHDGPCDCRDVLVPFDCKDPVHVAAGAECLRAVRPE